MTRPLAFIRGLIVVASATLAHAAFAAPVSPDTPANMTADEIKTALAAAKPGKPADFSGKSMRNLDLSKFDFTGAIMTGVNLFGAKLADANLSKADLTRSNLNLAWLIHANFTDANLTDASVVGPVVAQGLDAMPGEIPIFKGANMKNARVQARFTGGDLNGANFAGADISAHLMNQSMGLMHTEMAGAKLEGADFSGTNMGHVDLSYADLKGANFSGADLTRADLTGADASGADFTGATLSGTEMADIKLGGAKGLEKAKGLDQARGYKRVN